MHTLNRILTLLFLLVVFLPPVTFAFLFLDERHGAEQSLDRAIDTAVGSWRTRSGIVGMQRTGERILQSEEHTLQTLTVRKLQLRREITERKRIVRVIEGRYAVTLSSAEEAGVLIAREQKRLTRVLHARFVRRSVQAEDKRTILSMRGAFHGAAEAQTEELLERVEIRFLKDLLAAQTSLRLIAQLSQEREEVLTQYHASQQTYDRAGAMIERSRSELEQIKTIMADVHAQVLAMQGELARIDARIRRKAQRDLLEKGLLDPVDAAGENSLSFRPPFSWPVYGRVSAGFHDAHYQRFFGIPHEGIDIPVAQASPVHSAAEGVVFLVRDGGEKGYTYVLIGHRGGFATLYGNLSAVSVSAGEDVRPGQQIGLSGGEPGTPGSGPMTTGPHLHFEVIQAGVNVDPKTVLP